MSVKKAQEQARRCHFRFISSSMESVAEVPSLLSHTSPLTLDQCETLCAHLAALWHVSCIGVWHSPFLGKPRWIAQGCKICLSQELRCFRVTVTVLTAKLLKGSSMLTAVVSNKINNTEDLCFGAHSYRDFDSTSTEYLLSLHMRSLQNDNFLLFDWSLVLLSLLKHQLLLSWKTDLSLKMQKYQNLFPTDRLGRKPAVITKMTPKILLTLFV